MRRGKELRCAQIDRLDGIISEMLVETCTPSDGNAVARLQDGFETRACAAAHHAQMPAVRARHQVEDGIRLPVPLRAQHDRVIGPLHLLYERLIITPSETPVPSRGSVQ